MEQIEQFGGLAFVLFFFSLILIFSIIGRNRPGRNLRDIPAYVRLRRAVGLAVEAGTRLHISLGWGGLSGPKSTSALVGLAILERVARAASISDCPPVATAGEGALSILSQDTLRGAYHAIGEPARYDFNAGRLAGVTPYSYAAGAMSVVHDEQISASLLAGHFGSEVALITEASERSGSLTVAGTDSIPGQAVLYATAEEPLIGEELYAGGAYLGAGFTHAASLRAQDIVRWILILIILVAAVSRIFLPG